MPVDTILTASIEGDASGLQAALKSSAATSTEQLNYIKAAYRDAAAQVSATSKTLAAAQQQFGAAATRGSQTALAEIQAFAEELDDAALRAKNLQNGIGALTPPIANLTREASLAGRALVQELGGPMGYVFGQIASQSKLLAPILSSLFPVAVAGFFIDVLFKVGTAIYDLYQNVHTARERIDSEFRAIILSITTSTDSLQVTNDKLKNDIALLEHKPQNGLKVALDETKVSADHLAEGLSADLKTLGDKLKEEEVGFLRSVYTLGQTTTGLTKEMRGPTGGGGFTATEERAMNVGLALIKSSTTQTELLKNQTSVAAGITKVYTDEVAKLSVELTEAERHQKTWGNTFAHDATKIELYKKAIEDLNAELKKVPLELDNAGKGVTKDLLTKGKQDYQDAEAQIRKKTQTELEDAKLSGDSILDQLALVRRQETTYKSYSDIVRELKQKEIELIKEQYSAEKATYTQEETAIRKRDEDALENLKLQEGSVGAQLILIRKQIDAAKEYDDVVRELKAKEIALVKELVTADEAAERKEVELADSVREAKNKANTQIAEAGAKGKGDLEALALSQQKFEVEQRYDSQIEHNLSQQLAYMSQIATLEEKAREAKIASAEAELKLAEGAAIVAQFEENSAPSGEAYRKAYEDEISSLKTIAALKQQIALLTKENANAEIQATTKAVTLQSQTYQRFFNQINQGFIQTFNSLITHQKTWEQSFEQIVNKMELAFIDKLLMMSLKWVEQHLFMTIVHAGATTQQVAITATGAAATQAINSTTLLKEINIMAARAAMGAYDAIVGIPFVGPALAPIAATTAGLAVEALGLLALETGTNYVPRTGPYQLHQGEAVVPKQYNPSAGGSGSGGGNTFNFHGGINVGSGGRQGAVDFVSNAKSQLRRLNLRAA